jgi:O-antigen/teichoic acid export membrane protein
MVLVGPIARRIQARLQGEGGVARTVRAFSWLMSEKAVALGVGVLVNIPVARYLGPENFGVWSYVAATATLVAPAAALGLDHLTTKELVQRRDREDAVLGTAMALRKLGGAVVILALLAYAALASFPDDRLPLYLVLVVGASLIGNAAVINNWFIAHHKLRAHAVVSITKTLFFAAVRSGQVRSGASLTAFIVVAAVEALTSGIVAYFAYRTVRDEKLRWTFDLGLARDMLSRSWPLLISGLAAAIYLKLDLIMLAHLGSASEAGVYAAAARLSEIWYFAPILLTNAMFPSLLQLRDRSFKRYQRRLQDALDVLAGAATMLALAVTLAAPLIVHLLYGPAYAGAGLILSIHIWAGVFIFMRSVLSKWLIAEDLYIFSLVTHGTGALSNIALNIVLIPWWGGLGAAVATLVSYAAASYLALLLHPRTRPMFVMMCKALLWPRRLPQAMQRVSSFFRDTGR